MDDRLKLLAHRSEPGVHVTVTEDDGASVSLSWGQGTSLVAKQVLEWLEVWVHGIKVGGMWVSAAEVELFLECLSSQPAVRSRRRFSTALTLRDGYPLGSRLALRGRLPEATFPPFPGQREPVTWFVLFEDGLLVAREWAREAVWLASDPQAPHGEPRAFSSDRRLLTMHDHPDGYDGISAVSFITDQELDAFVRAARKQPPGAKQMTVDEMLAWHSTHSANAPWEITSGPSL
ncbi:hypothetical protein IPV09_01895 [Tessaracoccus sp. SD287]|uniref:hypothetical protein n=1 Tax=Tessaracoccus sp. SD287 TaxID=2782008 RepID=UPI001A974546|nr:hypothetical protein [Tessaracoccus sp. SD287]MBO1030084.1 hypothetical protein [Tessaracoccus sp. SD287]